MKKLTFTSLTSMKRLRISHKYQFTNSRTQGLIPQLSSYEIVDELRHRVTNIGFGLEGTYWKRRGHRSSDGR